MDEKCLNWLRDSFFQAFPGNQKVIYPTLHRYGLDFRSRPYDDVWDELSSRYGTDRLAAVVKEEVLSRLLPERLEELRKL